MDNSRIIYLIDRCLAGSAIPEEKEELADWINGQEDDGVLKEELERAWTNYQPGEDIRSMAGPALARIEAGLFQEKDQAAVIPMHTGRRRKWWIAAAVIAAVMGTAVYSLVTREKIRTTAPVAFYDAAPGGNRAVLTLGNGSHVLLDSAAQGKIADEGAAEVAKLKEGQLEYTPKGRQEKVVYNILTTPRGGQYQLKLPDGTKVWLNASSSIHYPTAFTGARREVAITGEAYFEVADNARMPFRVKVNETTTIDVLGTHFNVNAYNDEASINTTLLQGAVKVVAAHNAQLLAPGQQLQVVNQTSFMRLIKDADVNGAVAWKEGAFSFTNADLQAVMRQLARWYNVEVEYRGNIQPATFSGEIGRELSLSQVLKGLTKTRINYRIENGNKLIILP